MSSQNLSRRSFLGTGTSAGIGAMIAGKAQNACTQTRRPNVIILHIDDMAQFQIGCYGGNVLTPHMDSLARDGMKFNRYYLCCSVCSPSRYSIVTGQYPTRKIAFTAAAKIFPPVVIIPFAVYKPAYKIVYIRGDPYVFSRSADLENIAHFPFVYHIG